MTTADLHRHFEWVNGETSLNADNMNRIEDRIDDVVNTLVSLNSDESVFTLSQQLQKFEKETDNNFTVVATRIHDANNMIEENKNRVTTLETLEQGLQANVDKMQSVIRTTSTFKLNMNKGQLKINSNEKKL